MSSFFIYIIIYFFCVVPCSAKICITERTNGNNLSIQKNIFDNAVHVWITSDNVPVYQCFQNRGTPIKYLSLGERFYVVNNNYMQRSEGKKWSLLTASHTKNVNKTTIIGWVSDDNLLNMSTPLKDPKTNLLQKILIKEGDSHQGEILNVYKGRDCKKSERFINTRTVFYVYDYFPETAPTPLDAKLLLIGVESHLDLLTSKALLPGWIPRDKATFWKTRTACEFPPGVTVQLTNDNGEIIYSSKKVTERLNYNELRNPILQEEKDHYVIGLFCRLSAEELLFQRKVEHITTGLEVLFVMDGSRSMSLAFTGVIEGIKIISSKMSKQCKLNNMQQPRFALMIYRDQKTQNQPLKIVNNKTVPANIDYCQQETKIYPMGNITRFLETLKQQIACDSDSSYTESVYKGLIHGVQQCKFRQGESDNLPKRLRVIIHIGDEGDNGRGNFSSEDVVRSFNQYHIFKYFAVDVSETSHFEKSRFTQSVDPIIQKTNALFIAGHGKIDQIILDHLEAIHQNAVDLNYQINIIAKGFAGKSPGMSGVVSKEILEYAKKIIQAHGIQLNQSDIYHQYVEGRYPKGQPIDIRILASMTDIENITQCLSGLLEAKSNLKQRKDLWEKSLKTIIGNDACEENGQEISLEECNKKHNGIPIKAGFMRYTKRQFLNLSGNELLRVFCEAKIALEQFRSLTENKYMQSITIDSYSPCLFKPLYCMDLNGDGEIIHENQAFLNKPIDKYFFREGGESMAWIPLHHFQTK